MEMVRQVNITQQQHIHIPGREALGAARGSNISDRRGTERSLEQQCKVYAGKQQTRNREPS